jgi:GT2 family glycosyltransferase
VAATTPDVSIIVVGWRRAPQLLGCLHALRAAPSLATREVLLALNEPAPELVAELEAHTDLFDIVDASPVNRGFALANNDAAARASGDILFFVNDDALVQEGWLEPLVDRLVSEPHIGAVGSVQVDEHGRIVEAGAFVYRDGAPLQIDAAVLGGDAPVAGPVLYVSGAAVAVERATFQALGGFDPGYFPAYFEDADLSLKLLGAGLATWLEPRSVVRHHHGTGVARSYASFLTERNRSRFVERWAPVLAQLPEHPSSYRPQGARRDVEAVRSTLSGLLEGERFGPVLPNATRPDDEELPERAAAITGEYVASLEGRVQEATERIAELEAIESHLQVLVAERQDALDRYVPRVSELEVLVRRLEHQLTALDEELARFRSRLAVRAADKAAGLSRRIAP